MPTLSGYLHRSQEVALYCRECLHDLASRSISGNITCPECRRDVPVPNNDVSNFTVPHRVNRLMDMYRENQSGEAETAMPQPATCHIHSSQPLAMYCRTCEKLFCRDCVLLYCSQMNHKFGFIDDLVEEYQTDLDRELEPVRVLHKQASCTLDEISTAEREVRSAKEAKLQSIASRFDALYETLAQERRHFTESIEKPFQEQEALNSAKKREVSEVLVKLESLINSVEIASQNEPKPVFLAGLASKKQSIENVKKTKINLPSHHIKLPEIGVELCSPSELKDLCQVKNFLYRKGDAVRGHVERSLDLSKICVNKTSEINLYLNPNSVQRSFFLGKVNITIQLHCCRSHCSRAGIVREITPKKYLLSFLPVERGKHELHIKYDDVHVCGSPIPVYVIIWPQQLKRSPHTCKKIKDVCGIKYHEGCLYINKAGSSIKVLDASTRSVVRTIEMPGVFEVMVDTPHIYISDSKRNRVIKMDLRDARIIKTTGYPGVSPGEFQCPNGIRLSKDDEVYVCDTYNHRIQVFDKDLNLIRVIGSKGDGNGFFNVPNDLDFDEAGNLYVVDNHNHRIQVLTPQGRHIRNIGEFGTKEGYLRHPCSAAIQRDLIYITDRINRRIAVYKITGEFVATFGEGTMSLPECIAIDDEGYIHVTDHRSKLITF